MVQAELNRPLKFRVWNNKEQCFDNPAVLEVFDNSGELNHLYDKDKLYSAIQQYTGIKDINGKEIYEGDFVKGATTKEYGAVYWDRTNACFSYISNNFSCTIAAIKGLEVVGNIYEGVLEENKPKSKELQIGDVVTVTGQSSFCSTSTSKILDIKTKYDEDTGIPYKIYVTEGDHKFDGRNGWALNNPTAYYIKEIEEVAHNKFVNNKENQDFVKELLEEIGMG